MTQEAPVESIDGGDLACARLLILLRNRVAELEDGTIVHLNTTDPVAPIDLPAWCRMTGHTYLGTVEDAEPLLRHQGDHPPRADRCTSPMAAGPRGPTLASNGARASMGGIEWRGQARWRPPPRETHREPGWFSSGDVAAD
jgi:tRNA 2-thiouridine synthesizing protein A